MQGDDQSNKYSSAQNKLKLKAEKTTPIHTLSSSSLSASGNHSCKKVEVISFGFREETIFPSDTSISVKISKQNRGVSHYNEKENSSARRNINTSYNLRVYTGCNYNLTLRTTTLPYVLFCCETQQIVSQTN